MSTFVKELVKNKLKRLNEEKLLQYSSEYGFSITRKEAQEIISFLKTTSLDVFNKKDQEKMFKELAQITNPNTAAEAKKLLHEITASYGMEHLFK